MVKSAGPKKGDDNIVIIKKYANRRLYNTDSSKYITLDFLAELTRDKIDFKVIDAKSGEDITHNVLTQIIMEEEANGEQLLPLSFLKQIIGMYDNSMRKMVPGYLEQAMEGFQKNQQQIQSAFETAISGNPLAELTKKNMKILSGMAPEFVKKATPFGSTSNNYAGKTQDEAESAKEDIDLEAMKRQMAELQAKIDSLSKEG